MPEHSPKRLVISSSPMSQTIDEVVQVNLPLIPRTPHHAPVIEEVRNSENESKEDKGIVGEIETVRR